MVDFYDQMKSLSSGYARWKGERKGGRERMRETGRQGREGGRGGGRRRSEKVKEGGRVGGREGGAGEEGKLQRSDKILNEREKGNHIYMHKTSESSVWLPSSSSLQLITHYPFVVLCANYRVGLERFGQNTEFSYSNNCMYMYTWM